MRPMFGRGFEAHFQSLIFALSNFPLKVKEADGALAKRLAYAACTAPRVSAKKRIRRMVSSRPRIPACCARTSTA